MVPLSVTSAEDTAETEVPGPAGSRGSLYLWVGPPMTRCPYRCIKDIDKKTKHYVPIDPQKAPTKYRYHSEQFYLLASTTE